MRPALTRRRVLIARAIAIGADLIQVGLLPLLGAFSPVDDALDLVVAGVLTWLLGFHVALLPTLAIELIPFVDTFPTWTLAVFYVTRGQGEGRDRAAQPSPPLKSPPTDAGSRGDPP